MGRILVLPEEFRKNLIKAYNNEQVKSKWGNIRVYSTEDMIWKIISVLNKKYPKLRIKNYIFEDKETIKVNIGNLNTSSNFTGYLKKGEIIEALLFYIEPSLDSANDIITRQIMPSLLGIYQNISKKMSDLHFNNKPIFIVNLNENNRSLQNAVKKLFVCANIVGFNYIDIFERGYTDVIKEVNVDEYEFNEIKTIDHFDTLMKKGNENPYFKLDKNRSELILLSKNVTQSKNQSAEIYRYFYKILPAIYLSVDSGYSINYEELYQIKSKHAEIFCDYLKKL